MRPWDDSTNLQAPDFSPTAPTYPLLAQLVRVTAFVGTVGALRVYAGLTQQYSPPLSLRDREDCYVVEANNLTLATGIYDCRLIGSHADLPLYAVTCCPTT